MLLTADWCKRKRAPLPLALTIDHGLREGSAREAKRVAAWAAKRGVAHETLAWQGAKPGANVQAEAREARYRLIGERVRALGLETLLTGHTQDDQAETFLLKLMRGAGLTGLAGIYPRRGAVVRPLLDVRDADLQAYLVSQAEHWIEDETNADVENPRNRVRHRILPELDLAAGGSTQPAIARAAALIRDDAQWLDELADERFRALASDTETGLELDIPGLTTSPSPVLRRVLLRALRTAAGGREVGLDHVEAVTALLGRTSGGVDVPGSRAELRGAKLVFLQQKTGPR